MRKKSLALILACALAASCLAGCGSDDDSTSASGTATSSSSNSGSTDEGGQSTGTNEDAVQNLIDATSGTVKLTVWASEEDQELTTELLEDFKSTYSQVSFDISLGAQSESTAKDTVLTDVEAAADVYAFADDQIADLVAGGALQEIAATYTFDVGSSNLAKSVEAATVDGKLYAYPMTADNGYFMFYDKSVFTEDDVKSLESMIAAADKAGKKIAIQANSGWYLYSFFAAKGLSITLNADGTNTCDWNAAGGTDVAQAILDTYGTGTVVNLDDGSTVTGIQEGTICAAVNGTWNAAVASDSWGENYGACKLPTIKIAGEDCQMGSFSGCKLIGVNPHAENLGWAMILAEFLTNEQSQIKRFEQRMLGPSNVAAFKSDEVQSAPAIAALGAQSDYSTLQRVGGSFWDPSATLGEILASGNPDGTDLQTLLDTAVAGITQ